MKRMTNKTMQWLEKLFFSDKKGFQKSDNVVHPCIIDGQDAIVYKKGLRERNPAFYAQLNRFARQNNIFLKEDQRGSFRSVRDDRRSGFMPMMVLGASLLTQNAAAASKNHDHSHNHYEQSQAVVYQIDDAKNFSTQEQHQIADLLQWIYSEVADAGISMPSTMPNVKRVSSYEMFKVAFGKDMPRAMNQKNMQIYGLYNFKNKTVYILDTIDLTTEKGKSILLHELVHYVQYENDHDKKVDCKNKLEHLAYNLEAKYLNQHGERVGFTQGHVQRVSRCG